MIPCLLGITKEDSKNPTHVYNFLNIRTQCQTQSECPSFAFETDGERGPSDLASPLVLMAHAVPCLLGLTTEDS